MDSDLASNHFWMAIIRSDISKALNRLRKHNNESFHHLLFSPSIHPSSPTVSHPLSHLPFTVHSSGAINNQLPSMQNHSTHCSVLICLNVEHREKISRCLRLLGLYIYIYVDTLHKCAHTNSRLLSPATWHSLIFDSSWSFSLRPLNTLIWGTPLRRTNVSITRKRGCLSCPPAPSWAWSSSVSGTECSERGALQGKWDETGTLHWPGGCIWLIPCEVSTDTFSSFPKPPLFSLHLQMGILQCL